MELKIMVWLVEAFEKGWNAFWWLLRWCVTPLLHLALWLVGAMMWIFHPLQARLFLRYKKYPKQIQRAYKSGDYETVKTLCAQWLEMNEQHRRTLAGLNYGQVLHEAHDYLGFVALRENDLETAKKHLLASGNIEPSLSASGPSFSLAAWILKNGEREAVLTFLDSVSQWWANDSYTPPQRRREVRETLKRWKKAARAGHLPDDPRWQKK